MSARMRIGTSVAALLAVGLGVFAVVAQQQQTPSSPRRGRQTQGQSAPTEQVPLVRLQATVFRVAMDKSRAVELDAKSLAAEGPTPPAMLKALQRLGTPTVNCTIDQLLAADGRSQNVAEIAQDVPYVAGTNDSEAAISRTKIGVSARAEAAFPEFGDDREVSLGLIIEVSDVQSGTVQAAPSVKSPIFQRSTQTLSGLTQLDQPVVLLSFSSGGDYAESGAGFVTLLTVTKVE